jgi:hypothetical protein
MLLAPTFMGSNPFHHKVVGSNPSLSIPFQVARTVVAGS